MRKIVKLYTNLIDNELRYNTALFYRRSTRRLRQGATVEVRDLTDAQKREVDEFYLAHWGKKVDYTEHALFTSFTGCFDPAYITQEVYYPGIEHAFVTHRDYSNVFEDKNLVPLLAKAAGVKTPATLVSNVDGLLFDENRNLISLDEMADCLAQVEGIIVKPAVGTCGGKGIRIEKQLPKTHEGLMKLAGEIQRDFKTNYIVQDLIKNCQSLHQVHPQSLNTFRVVTYVLNGQINAMPSLLRMGRNAAQVDNLSAGGILAGINDDGTLCDYIFSWLFDYKADSHPDTGFTFEGKRIPEFPQVVEAAKRMHRFLAQMKIVNWDFTLDETGEPVLIEINGTQGSGYFMTQIAHGQGAFGKDTAQVLETARDLLNLNKAERNVAFSAPELWN